MFEIFSRRPHALLLAITAIAGFSGAAHAQRAGESAVNAADDAFGTKVGSESLGLYDPGNARGFSPLVAGNVRIEGLYFDQQPALNDRLVRGSSVRVGISAQSYAFRAPTGVADYRLRIPGDKEIVSAVVTGGPYTTYNIEVDGQFPIIADTFSVGLGISRLHNDDDFGVKSVSYSGAALALWRPSENADITAFYSRTEDCTNYIQPQVFTGGPFEPAHPPFRISYSQTWERGACTDVNAGGIGSVALPDDWSVRAGVFHSERKQDRQFGDLFRFVDSSGVGQHTIFRQPPLRNGSVSGEVRVAKTFAEGPRRHTFDATLRGRDVRRDFGGSATIDYGLAHIYTTNVIAAPTFNLTPTGDDRSRQGTAGIAYDGLWAGVGGIGLDVQKTFYHRSQVQPAPSLAVVKSNATPLLYSAAANFLLSRTVAVYASYTKGFEETGPAPQSAVNRGEAQPVSMTKQADAGFRYNVTPTFTVVAGVFQVEKPYFTVNTANRYGPAGNVRHRGVEFSATGQIIEGLRAVGGFVLIDPRISGDAVDKGLIGPVEISPKPRSVLMSLQYQPAMWRGFGIDGQVNHVGPQFVHLNNELRIKGTTQFNVGARYNFKISAVPASLRFQALNVNDVFTWNITPTSAFLVRPPRRYVLTLAADL